MQKSRTILKIFFRIVRLFCTSPTHLWVIDGHIRVLKIEFQKKTQKEMYDTGLMYESEKWQQLEDTKEYVFFPNVTHGKGFYIPVTALYHTRGLEDLIEEIDDD